jgi:hypothetical protein
MKRNMFCVALAATVAIPLGAPAQTVSLYGTVVSRASGAPVRLAKVFLKNGSGTIGPVLTDDNGAFSFDAPQGSYTLEVYTGAGAAAFSESVVVPGRLPPIQL